MIFTTVHNFYMIDNCDAVSIYFDRMDRDDITFIRQKIDQPDLKQPPAKLCAAL